MNSIDARKQPSAIRKRAREIYLAMGSLKDTEIYKLPIVQVMFTPHLCGCGCGSKIGYKGGSKRRFKAGHFVKLKWQMAFNQALEEAKNFK